ncbi:transglutaminase family protein [Enterococcus sp.]|uniref:transglutaminase-like domain-containing protein n=1 Tax=Enterococcus sp. TaxID=35783 RepID=UPI00290885F0|nr:transglutaminase family protein [Enterococcus sp.]MDU5334581.1 transglutaminase family protein [Enterococcus sp.]
MELESDKLADYLQDLPVICLNEPAIKNLSQKLSSNTKNEIASIQRAFYYVRDKIDHSWDIQATRVTKTSVEVLESGHGICYAKANLLTGLLRRAGIPTGYCYQKLLLFDEVDKRYCIHALNAVYIKSQDAWFRLDARGNKTGIDAQFSMNKEHLAFNPDTRLGERDYNVIYTKPNRKTMRVLEESNDALAMYVNTLPESL